jgi:DNA recombination protein RmuC
MNDPVWLAVLLGGLTTLLSAYAALRPVAGGQVRLADSVDDLRQDLAALRNGLAEDLRRGREEAGAGARDLRGEVQAVLARLSETLGGTMDRLGAAQAEKVDTVASVVRHLGEANERRLGAMRKDNEESATALRAEIDRQLRSFGEGLRERLDGGGAQQKERLDAVAAELRRLVAQNAEAHEALRRTVEGRLEILRGENAAKLEEMRRTVDEKLQGTLEERLGEKFKLVSAQLEQVFKSVGEVQSLAQGVGDLKRVLSNVKTRGTWAEVSLGGLLEQVLAPDQFVRNAEVQPGSGERVEFAIRLPGGEDERGILLPIDAKFPSEDYDRLLDASDRADAAGVEAALKGLEARIRAEGAKICSKYVCPPHTTDFGIMYLPTEGLYAEVIRRPGLVDHLQGQCRIVVAGPTVLLALLNSLRMGFRTLAIQQRSSEVWQTLAAVRTEFATYGTVLDKVKKKLTEASNHIDTVSRRGRAIERKLSTVDGLPEVEAVSLLALETLIQEGDDLLQAAE